jgi:hypothetical protein
MSCTRVLNVCSIAVVTLLTPSALECQCNQSLHAGITAQFVKKQPGFTRPSSVLLSFLLVNDSDTPLDVEAGSWKIAINGTELPDSDWIFGNGPMPTSGWSRLSSGEHYELAKALSLEKYFPKPGEYRIAWKGKTFHSPTITLKLSEGDFAGEQSVVR